MSICFWTLSRSVSTLNSMETGQGKSRENGIQHQSVRTGVDDSRLPRWRESISSAHIPPQSTQPPLQPRLPCLSLFLSSSLTPSLILLSLSVFNSLFLRPPREVDVDKLEGNFMIFRRQHDLAERDCSVVSCSFWFLVNTRVGELWLWLQGFRIVESTVFFRWHCRRSHSRGCLRGWQNKGHNFGCVGTS